ncbi:hypothetical protein CBS101457_003571 [Exobasidium rhododendri]|nr:hypothetical protein CBS101457_003571 [Exobasidium rhododendri]
MLRPKAVQEALTALLESPSVPADSALIVFSDSGTIYAQASTQNASSQFASTSTNRHDSKPLNESQRLQRSRQPGLVSLLGTSSSLPLSARYTAGNTNSPSPHAMELVMNADERSKIIGALACRCWTEEMNRIRRLLPKQRSHMHSAPASETGMIRSFSASTGGGGGGGGGGGSAAGNVGVGKGPSRLRRIEQSSLAQNGTFAPIERFAIEQGVEQESATGACVAVPGTLINQGSTSQGSAPLLLESELGASLVMPLHYQTDNSLSSSSSQLQTSPLFLLILSSRHTHNKSSTLGEAVNKESNLSNQEWSDLYDSAHALAVHISPALRKAFGREEGVPGEREMVGDAATVSDIESSLDMEGVLVVGQDHGAGGVGAVSVF